MFDLHKSLGEDISQLVLCWYMRHLHVARLHAFAYEVVLDIDVFGASVVDGVLRNVDCAVVVFVNREWCGEYITQILEESPRPEGFSDSFGCRHVFGFGGGESHCLLLLRAPTDWYIVDQRKITSH